MKYLHLTWFHLKRIVLNSWGFLLMTLVFPLITISGFLFIMGSDSSLMTEQANAVINHSNYVAEEIKPHLDESFQEYFVEDAEEAFRQLDQIEVSMVYEIPSGFPHTNETIQVHSIHGENRDSMFEADFLSVLTDSLLNEVYAEADIQFESNEVAEPKIESSFVNLNNNMSFVLFMMLFFMGYSTGFIGGDLAKMRKEELLTRSIVSNTYSWQILGSVLGAYMVYNVLSGLVIVLLSSGLFDIPITNLGLIFGLILSMALFVSGLTMLLFRIFKNETLIQMIGFLGMMILAFVPLFTQSIETIAFLQYVSPFYWVFESLDTGQIFPNVLIIALYGLVLFTAGSFKVERLVQD